MQPFLILTIRISVCACDCVYMNDEYVNIILPCVHRIKWISKAYLPPLLIKCVHSFHSLQRAYLHRTSSDTTFRLTLSFTNIMFAAFSLSIMNEPEPYVHINRAYTIIFNSSVRLRRFLSFFFSHIFCRWLATSISFSTIHQYFLLLASIYFSFFFEILRERSGKSLLFVVP